MLQGISGGAEVPAPGAFCGVPDDIEDALHGHGDGRDNLTPVGLDAVAVTAPVDDANAAIHCHGADELSEGLAALQAALEVRAVQREVPAQILPAKLHQLACLTGEARPMLGMDLGDVGLGLEQNAE
jgi:hypothetical protein